jgi:hypothetical protein
MLQFRASFAGLALDIRPIAEPQQIRRGERVFHCAVGNTPACPPATPGLWRSLDRPRKLFASAFSLFWLEDLALLERSILGEYSPLADLLPTVVPALVPELSIIVVAFP